MESHCLISITFHGTYSQWEGKGFVGHLTCIFEGNYICNQWYVFWEKIIKSFEGMLGEEDLHETLEFSLSLNCHIQAHCFFK